MRTAPLGELTTTFAGGEARDGSGDGPIVVLLHGYGAPGTDLVPLARQLDVPRSVRFAFPMAPLELAEVPGGRAWWPIDVMALQQALLEGRERDLSLSEPDGLAPAREQIETALHALGDAPVLLGGFSQGAMLALDVALHTQRPLAGVVLMSGTLLCEDAWRSLAAAQSPLEVLQSHGRADPMLPFTQAERLRDLLTAAGHRVEFVPFNGGHEIPLGVLDALARRVRALAGA